MKVSYNMMKVRREEVGLSDNGLALAAKVDRQVIYRIRRGESVRPASVLAIARFLGCTVGELAEKAPVSVNESEVAK